MFHHRSIPALAVALALVATGLAWTPAVLPPPARADTGLIAHWTFDEGTGSVAADATGNGHDGAMSGSPTWITSGAPVGTGALAFDGVDDVVVVPDSPGLEPASITVAGWVKGGVFDAPATIVAKGANGDCSTRSYFLLASGLWEQADGFRYGVAGPGGGIGYPLWNEAWHHVAFSYNATSHELRSYVDGIYRGGGGGAESIPYGLAADDLVIGRPLAPCTSELGYPGAIDDVRIYDHVLADAEVADLLPPIETTTTVITTPASPVYPDDVTFTATVTPTPVGGPVSFVAVKDGTPEFEVGRGFVDMTTGLATYTTGGFDAEMPAGEWSVQARYLGYGASQPSTSEWRPLSVAGMPGSLQLLSLMNPQPVGRTATLWVNVEPLAMTGSLTFYRISGEDRIEIGTAPIIDCPYVTNCKRAAFDLPSDLGVGTYPIIATYEGSAAVAATESNVLIQKVGPRPTTTSVSVVSPRVPPTTVLKNDVVSLQLNVWDTGDLLANSLPITGEMSVRVDGVEIAKTTPNIGIDLPTAGLSIGNHTITAVYGGSNDHAASTSDPVVLTVKADIAEATGVGVSATTFYPYKDGYRDTVAIRGVRSEPISVGIRITSPTNSVVRTASIARGTGSYSYTWNGRTSSGSMLPSGKYKVVQTLTDAGGAKTVVTSYVTISGKRLYYYTTTIEKTAAQYTKKTSSWIGWQFTMPSATTYKSITFSVYGRTTVPPARFGPWDTRQCAWTYTWSPNCVTRTKYMPYTNGWASISVSPTYERYGRYVRGLAFVSVGNAWVYKARLKVTYGILK